MSDDESRCEFCKIGYHAPFERFEKVSVNRDGPEFLKRCKVCGALWHETLRSAKEISAADAIVLFPDFEA